MSKIPIQIDISIASAQEALQYWLSNVVFKDNIKIDSVRFSKDTHFTIKFVRGEETK